MTLSLCAEWTQNRILCLADVTDKRKLGLPYRSYSLGIPKLSVGTNRVRARDTFANAKERTYFSSSCSSPLSSFSPFLLRLLCLVSSEVRASLVIYAHTGAPCKAFPLQVRKANTLPSPSPPPPPPSPSLLPRLSPWYWSSLVGRKA